MSIKIQTVIDSRQTDLLGKIKNPVVETLSTGDVIYRIKGTHQILGIIVIDTFSNYLKNGALNQLKNMGQILAKNPNLAVINLLIEFNIKPSEENEKVFLERLMNDTFLERLMNDTFLTYMCVDTDKTIEMIEKIGKQLEIRYKNALSTGKKYLYPMIKKTNMTPSDYYICQLTDIPNVSIEMAKAIQSKYKTMTELIHAYDSQPTAKKRETMLQDIVVTSTEKVGEIMTKHICEYVYGVQDSVIEPEAKLEEKVEAKLEAKLEAKPKKIAFKFESKNKK